MVGDRRKQPADRRFEEVLPGREVVDGRSAYKPEDDGDDDAREALWVICGNHERQEREGKRRCDEEKAERDEHPAHLEAIGLMAAGIQFFLAELRQHLGQPRPARTATLGIPEIARTAHVAFDLFGSHISLTRPG